MIISLLLTCYEPVTLVIVLINEKQMKVVYVSGSKSINFGTKSVFRQPVEKWMTLQERLYSLKSKLVYMFII